MSHQLPRKADTARTVLFLFVFPLAAGCGMTASGDFANRNRSAPQDEPGRTASLDATPPSTASDREAYDKRPEVANRRLVPQETGVNQRRVEPAERDLPEEPTVDVASKALNPSIPVANRGKFMEQPPAPAAAASPETISSMARSAARATGTPPSHAVATTGFESFEQGKVHQVGTDDFQTAVLESNVPVVVDFYADWCGPCKQVAPLLDQFARERTGIRVVKVNIDHEQQLAREYRVKSIPTVMVFKKGDLVAEHTGLPKIRQALSP